MAIDATGTPTSLGIPKLDTSVDNPSGAGINAMMDAVDALIAQTPRSGVMSGIAAGSVPVWNGSAWVKPTGTPNGALFLRDDGSWAQVTGTTPYGTSLPGSPLDGAEYILVDSTTAPTYQWRFRYNLSNAGSYKWEFVGGAPIVSSNTNGGAFTNGGYAAASSPVTVTPPRAGVYDCRYFGMVDMAAANTNGERFYADWGGAGISPSSGNLIFFGGNHDTGFFVARENRLTLTTASALQMYFRVWQGTGFSLYHQSIAITPVQVS